MNDEATVASLLDAQADPDELSTMDAKTRALVRLGAVVVLGAAPVTYHWAAQVALVAGATDDEIVETLITVGPVSGFTRVVSAAPAVAIALGYDIDEAFEAPAKPGCRGD